MLDKDKTKTDSINIQDSQEKEENSAIEDRPELEALKPAQLESRDLNAQTETNKVTGKKVWSSYHESRLHACVIYGEPRVSDLNFKSDPQFGHDFMLKKEYKQKFPDADIEPRSWQCHINNNTVSWTKKCIVDHLSLNHLFTPKEFETTYLSLSATVLDKFSIVRCPQMSLHCMPYIISADLESIVKGSLFPHSDETTSSQDDTNYLDEHAIDEADTEPKGHSYGEPGYEILLHIIHVFPFTSCVMCPKIFWHGQFIKIIKLEQALLFDRLSNVLSLTERAF